MDSEHKVVAAFYDHQGQAVNVLASGEWWIWDSERCAWFLELPRLDPR